jgi:hypothetical protein
MSADELTFEDGIALALEVMDSDDMYDILPGDGQDDYIVDQFGRMLKERAKKERAKEKLRRRLPPKGKA